MKRRLVSCLFLLLALAASPEARATVDGYPPAPLYTVNRLLGSVAKTGATLTQWCPIESGRFNCVLLPEKTAPITSIPADGKLVEAWLFWSGSKNIYSSPTADFTPPNSPTHASLVADTCYQVDTGDKGSFFYCRKRVTDLLTGLPTLSGLYTVGNVDARISASCDTDVWCQARYAGWSLVVVWSAESQRKYRDVVIYDGFYHVDEDDRTGISSPMSIGGFTVGNPAYAEFAYFGLEGDDQLGEPFQKQLPKDHPLYCETCNDFLSLNSVKLTDTANPPNNVFNSTIEGESVDGVGVDIDTFNVGVGGLNILQSGQTNASIQVGSGDGNVGDPLSLTGGGESIFLGYMVLALDTYAPDFHGSGTVKDVDKVVAGGGETLTYTIWVKNEGSLLAHNVKVFDTIPAGTDYIPGSTTVDDVPAADGRGGQCPLSVGSGLNIGDLAVGTAAKKVKFQVRIKTGRRSGTEITNGARISSDETQPVNTNTVKTTVRAPEVKSITKTVADLNGGFVEPGDTLQYEITLKNESDYDVNELKFEDNAPAHTTVTKVNPPGGSTDRSTASKVSIEGISVPKRFSVTFTFLVKIDTADQWRSRTQIHGYQVSNQGTLTGPALASPMLTDDPAKPGGADPTVVTLTYAPDFSASSKAVVDKTSNPPAPGDTLEYSITLRNTGNRTVPVVVTDRFSPYVEYTFDVGPLPPGARWDFTSGVLTVDGFDLAGHGAVAEIKYRVRIVNQLPSGTTEIKNTAVITTPADSSVSKTVSAELFVTVAPDFSTSKKAAIFGADDRRRTIAPGEAVRFVVTVANSGNRVAEAAYVLDQVDSRFENVVPEDGGTFDRAGRTIRWNLGDMAPAAQKAVAFTARAKTPLDSGLKIFNQAFVYSKEVITGVPTDDPATSAADDPVTLAVTFPYDFSGSAKAVQGDTGGVVKAGDLLTFTVTVVNASPGGLNDLLVVDTVDRGLSDVSVQAGTYNTITRAVNWTVPRLDFGRSVALTFTARVLPPTRPGSFVENFATVTGGGASLKTNTVRLAVVEQPGFTASTKVATPDGSFANRTHKFQAGSKVIWLVTATNTGTVAATNVTITDAVDTQNLVNITVRDGGQIAGGVITWTVPSIGIGAFWTVSFEADVRTPIKNGTTIRNQASIVCAENQYPANSDDPDTVTPADPTIVTVESAPDFILSRKTASVGGSPAASLKPGDTVTFEITAVNTGNAEATGVVIEDTVDTSRLTVQTYPGGTFDGKKVRYSIPSLGVGAQNAAKVSFAALVRQCVSGQVENLAHISAAEVPNGFNTPKIVLPVSGAGAGGTFEKRASFALTPVRPGDRVEYSVAFTPKDQVKLCGAKLSDVVDSNLEDVQVSAGTYDPATRTVSFLPAAGADGGVGAFAYTFGAKVKKPLKDGTVVSNQAVLSASNLGAPFSSDDPATPAAADPTVFKVASTAFVYATKQADRPQAPPGGTVSYTITLTNIGDAIAEGGTLRDDISSIAGFLDAATPLDGGTYDPAGHVLSWTLPPLGLSPPNTYTYRFNARLKTGIPDGTEIANQAVAKGSNFVDAYSDADGDPKNGYQPTVVTVLNKPVFSSSTKLPYTATGAAIPADQEVSPGDQIVFKIEVKNTGTIDAHDVTVTDLVDSTNLAGVIPASGGAFDGARISWGPAQTPALKLIPSGGKTALSFACSVAASAAPGTKISNQAAVESSEGVKDVTDDPRTPAKSDATTLVVRSAASPDLSASAKAAAPSRSPLRSGDRIRYSITVKNVGRTDATGTTLTDLIDPQTSRYVAGSTTLNGRPIADSRGGKFPLEAGLKVTSASFGAMPGADEGRIVPWDGRGSDDELAVVTFEVTVLPGAQVVKNKARIDRDGGQPVWTNETVVPVGDVPFIPALAKTWFLKTDANANGVADKGDVVEFVLSFENAGAAAAGDVALRDPLSDRVSYVPGSMMVQRDGGAMVALTDAADGDQGRFDAADGVRGSVRLLLSDLGPGGRVRFAFDVTVGECGGFANQATLTYGGGVSVLSDADGDAGNGAQETVVPTCGGEQIFLSAAKDAADLNGGSLMPGDQVLYTLTLLNQGSGDLEAVTLEDDIPAHTTFKNDPKNYTVPQDAVLSFLPAPSGRYTRGKLVVTKLTIPRAASPADAVKLSFLVTADKDAVRGDQVKNAAVVYSPKFKQTTNTVSLIVGGTEGTAMVKGRVFQKRDTKETQFSEGKDIPLRGYTVAVDQETGSSRSAAPRPAGPASPGKRTARVLVDAAGSFEVANLAPGRYRLTVYSQNGVPFAGIAGIDLKEGDVHRSDMAIVPAGVIYDARSGEPIENATVVYYPDGASGLSLPSQKVPKELRVQKTDWTGMYAAELPAGGAYRIEVSGPSPSMIFPSGTYPPIAGYAKAAADGYVSTDFSERSRGAPYYLRVDSGKDEFVLKNNRIPLDRAESAFRIEKNVSKPEAARGDILTYTVTVQNLSSKAFRPSGAARTGGVSIHDYLPSGLRFIQNSARLYRAVNGKEKADTTVDAAGAAEISFGAISIGASETVRLRYEAVVGLEAKTGVLNNRARLYIEGRAVDVDASAPVRVVEDPIFDQGLLIGKVFCDSNGNGAQDPGEDGLGGARVFMDTGWYSDVDETGKYHFKGIPAGYHLVKLDVATLPPGSLPTGEVVKGLNFTPGLPAKVNFGVDCRLKKFAAARVDRTSEKVPGRTEPGPDAGAAPHETDWAEYGSRLTTDDAGTPTHDQRLTTRDGGALPDSSFNAGLPTPDAGLQPPAYSPQPSEDRSLATWVELPPPGYVARHEFLTFRGGTTPGNTVIVGSQAVPVREDGSFYATVKLAPGKNLVEVTAEDPAGHRSRVSYTIEYDPERVFVLALGEGIAGMGGLDLDGVSTASSLRVWNGVNWPGMLFHGRGVLYVKGMAHRRATFENIEYTLHFDTAKQRELAHEYFKEAYNPERYYPVYGDSASEVQDVNARDKLYLLVKADDSRLLVGNFVSDLRGVELLRYNRAFYGVDADLNRAAFDGNLGNRVKGFVSQDYDEIAHDRLVLRPTGGSVLYLRNGAVIEGSDRVDLVVRDKDSGLDVLRRTLARDIDYSMGYGEGRIILKQPVSATADSFSPLLGPGRQLAGHPVFLEVDYDYSAILAGGNRAYGARVEETVFKMLRLGGGYVKEEAKGREAYSIWGADAVLSVGKTAALKAEFAQSRSFDSTVYFSDDGGLSFISSGGGILPQNGIGGSAWMFEAQGDVGEALGKDGRRLALKAYAQDMDPGFSAGTSVLQQGMLKYGFDSSKTLPGDMELRFKGDALSVSIPPQPLTESAGAREMSFDKYSAYGSWQKKLGPWKVLAEDNYIYFRDNIVAPEEVHTDIAGAGLSYALSRRWELFGAQQGVMGGDPKLYDSFADRMFSTVGARYTIREGLVVGASETARWSGDNATQLGLKVPLSDSGTGSAYVNEKLGSWNGQFVTSSVLGAEDQGIPGTRTYGEYQVDSVSSNAMNRSVFGLNNRWPIAKGTYFNLDFEHTQVLGGAAYISSTDTALGAIPLSSSPYTAYGRPNQAAFAGDSRSPLQGRQAGLKSDESALSAGALVPYYGLNYPLGMMEGDAARDVFAVGLEFLRYEFFKIGTRLELRFDNADEHWNGQDRFQYLATLGSTWRFTRDLSFLAKLSVSDTQNQRYERREAAFMEASFGFALRPVNFDWINLIFKYSRLYEFRNFDVTADDAAQEIYSDIFSLIPIVETPFRLQIVEKLALKHAVSQSYAQPWTAVNMVLWINRLNFHLWKERIDLGAEYRVLVLLDLEKKDGYLAEVAIIPAKNIRFGVGYNFSSFSDNLYESLNHDASGFFVRLTGQY
ncbi:MAG: DUF11 domain-containing protein [Deltaproteobacteria bacterium]|nr:DUF11 domain-containing protein [Deltaproteobacteria bacterium]